MKSTQNTTPLTMTDATPSGLEATERRLDSMFDVLEATNDNVIAIRAYKGTTEGYRKLYELLAKKTDEYGTVHVFEDLPDFTLPKYLSNVYGIFPDLRYGSTFDIGRYGWVGDSNWLTLLHYQWLAITPFWPVSPDELRLFRTDERDRALEWVRAGIDHR